MNRYSRVWEGHKTPTHNFASTHKHIYSQRRGLSHEVGTSRHKQAQAGIKRRREFGLVLAQAGIKRRREFGLVLAQAGIKRRREFGSRGRAQASSAGVNLVSCWHKQASSAGVNLVLVHERRHKRRREFGLVLAQAGTSAGIKRRREFGLVLAQAGTIRHQAPA